MDKYSFGVCEWCLPVKGPDICRLAASAGLSGIALNIGSLATDLSLSKPEIREAYMHAAQENGVVFCALALNVFDRYTLLRPDCAEEDKVVRNVLKKAVEIAAEMCIPVIQVPAFGGNAIRTPHDMSATAEYLRWACDLASRFGIVIGSENMLSTEKNRELLRLVNRDNFKYYYDTENPVFFGFGDPEAMVLDLREDICQIHVKDGTSERLSSRLLGEGNTRFHECMETVKDIGYSGWIILENDYSFLPEGALERDLEILKTHCDKGTVSEQQ